MVSITSTMYWVKVVFKMLPFIHAIFNPIIYFAMSKNFRKMSILKLKNWSECQVLSKPIQHQHSSIALRGNAYAMTTTETAIENFRMEGKVSSKEANALSSQENEVPFWLAMGGESSDPPYWHSRPTALTATIRKKSVQNCLFVQPGQPKRKKNANIRINNFISRKTRSEDDLIEPEDILALKIIDRIINKQQEELKKNLRNFDEDSQSE